jgi:hypothetical protein
VQLHLAARPVLDDHAILERQRVLLHELAERARDLLRLFEVVICDCNQVDMPPSSAAAVRAAFT